MKSEKMNWEEWAEKLFCLIPSFRLRPSLEKLRGVKVGEGTRISQFAMIIGSKKLTIGKNCFIGKFVVIDALKEPITIEDNVKIAGHSAILSHETAYTRELGKREGPIIIKKNAYISQGTIVLSNVTIGEGAIVGAGSVIIEDVPPYTLVVGVPAKPIKKVKKNVTHHTIP